MSCADPEQPDSLDGWAVVKHNLFTEREPPKLRVLVQWNVIESRFAVAVHDKSARTRDRPSDPGAQASWAGLFSVGDLRLVHQQLTCVSGVLASRLPDLSAFEDGNIWDLLLPVWRSGPDEEARDLDAPCRTLEKYFITAVDLCGWKIVLDTLFGPEQQDADECFENLQEFRRTSMKEEMGRAKAHLRQLLQSHGTTDGMVALLAVYDEEDEAYQELVTVATAFFQYLLQPFRDMRELACLCKMEILKSLEIEDLGPKRVAALEKEAEEWSRKAGDAVASIQDITVTYFAQTSKALAGQVKQMEEDRCRFGAAAWTSAAPRLDKLHFLLAKENLQHMRTNEMCLTRKKNAIREKLSSLSSGGQSGGDELRSEDARRQEADRLEMNFYETQLELYDAKFEILKNEEQLLLAQILALRRQVKELTEEVVYYDVCEDPAELCSIAYSALHPPEPPSVRQLRRRLQTLEAQRGNICARRARLRNKKDQCTEAHEQKQLRAEQSSALFNEHHRVQLKREKRKEEEQTRKEWVDLEREKTLGRLRSFRQKHQGQYLLKTPRSRTCPSEVSCPDDQPLSIISLGSAHGPSPVRPAPRRSKPQRNQQPKDIPVQIYSAPPPATPPPPPPPLPPAIPPPPVQAPPSSEDAPRPLSESEDPPFPAKNTLRQNIGSMDEVLASLQRGQMQLRKAPPPRTASPAVDLRSNLMSAIRQGVALKKVVRVRAEVVDSGDNELERSIKAAMMRMKKVASDSDEDAETPSGDWDS